MSSKIELMQHALGINENRREPYRNYFLADSGHSDNSAWQELVNDGLATSRPAPGFACGETIYHVTEKGRELAISALPVPKKKTKYDEYLDADTCISFTEWLLGSRAPRIENRGGPTGWEYRVYRLTGDDWLDRKVEGDWCKTLKAAKASYKEKLKQQRVYS